jgi:hypothetical protein
MSCREKVYKLQKEVDFVYDHDPAAFATPREKIKDTFCIMSATERLVK